MSNVIADYEILIQRFLDGMMSIEEFQATYLNRFKNEGFLDEQLFELLDEIFGDVDSFTTNQELVARNPGVYLDEAMLRERLRIAASRLSALKK